MIRHLSCALLVLSCVFSSLPLHAADDAERERPRVGLVLSGGGARGAAHVGVLEVMEQLHVPVDFIVGTSMGSIVGGLYASGVAPGEMRERFEEIDWERSFQDKPVRKHQPFRRKQEDLVPLFRLEFGFDSKGVRLPSGLVAGQKLNFLLRTMLLHASRIRSFDALAIPFRAVTVDLDTGEVVVLDHGDLPNSIRASMAFPLAFTPVEIDGRQLVDGGVLRNLPIDVALEMGADRIIAVDVSSPLREPKRAIPSAFGVARRTVSLMTKENLADQRELLREQDLIITPDLDGILTFEGFGNPVEAIDRGLAAGRAAAAALRDFSVPAEEYEAWRSRHRTGRDLGEIEVGFVRVTGVERISPKLIARRVRTKPGDKLDLGVLEDDLERVYKIGEFETVEFELVEEQGRTGLVIHATEKSWGPWYMRPGAGIATDLAGTSSFLATGLLRRPQINRLGAEWRTFASLGETNSVFTEFFQPVEYTGTFFVAPVFFGVEDRDDTVFTNEGKSLAEGSLYFAELGLGTLLGNKGEVRLGIRRGKTRAALTTGVGASTTRDLGAVRLGGTTDMLDNAFFPGQGTFAELDLLASREGLGADDDFERLFAEFTQAGSVGSFSIVGTARYGNGFGSALPFYADFGLGGFLNLSGLEQDELSGTELGFARILSFREFGDVGGPLGGPFYLGASLEGGNVWTAEEDASLSDLRLAGSAFAGVETLLGPIYVGYGLTEGGNGSFYLFLGRLFGGFLPRF